MSTPEDNTPTILDPEAGLTPEQIATRRARVAEIGKDPTFGDKTAEQKNNDDNPVWTIEALRGAGLNGSPISEFLASLQPLWLTIVSFLTGDNTHADAAARAQYAHNTYDPKPGDQKTTLADMPNAAQYAAKHGIISARGLDGASADLGKQFPVAADGRQANLDTSPAPTIGIKAGG